MRSILAHWAHPVTHRIHANYPGYWSRYRWLMLFAALAALADYASTVRFMLADGIDYEIHPAIRLGAHFYGPVLGPLVGKLLQLWALFLVTLYLRRLAAPLYLTVAVVYAAAAWYNVWGRDSFHGPTLADLPPLMW